MNKITKKKEEVKTDIAPYQNNEAMSPEQLISQAIIHNVPVETLERLMQLRDKLKAEAAREAYFAALSEFQSECPEIEKKKTGGRTNAGAVAYYYAPLDDIVRQVKGLLRNHGFSYSFQTEVEESRVTVICEARHKGGHVETSRLVSPMSTRTQVMSAPQQVAATVTFLKRYAFCNVFGIMTSDEDVDGKDLGSSRSQPKPKHLITEFQTKKLFALLHELGRDPEEAKEKIKEAYKLESFNDLSNPDATKVIQSLEKKLQDKKEQSKMVEKAAEEIESEQVKPSLTNIKCYGCAKEIEKVEAYNNWYCDEKCNQVYVERTYKKKGGSS